MQIPLRGKLLQLTPLRRELMLRVMDGDKDLAPIMYSWNRRPRVEEVLCWLIANRYTGRTLLEFMQHSHGARIHGFFQWVLQQIEKSPTPPPIILGRDW
jgi:hypothetical protein